LVQLPLLYLLQKFSDSLREKIGSVVGVIESFSFVRHQAK